MKYIGFVFLVPALLPAADFMTGQAARVTIGQQTFTAQDSGNPSASQLGAASGLAYANNTLFVADSNRVQASPILNRVLIFNNVNGTSGFVPGPTADIPQGVRCPVCVGTANVVVGQSDFTKSNVALTQTGLRTPTAVASDGQILVIADTDNNRVLIYRSIPQTNGAPADVVLGQADFKSLKQPPVVDNKSFRGPQGVWIQGTRLFVADTQNHRVLVWNTIPTTNGQPADYVLGEPNFTTAPSPETFSFPAQPNNLFYPVSVSSDGQRLFVTDLGHDRVLIWNSIPTQTAQPADVAVGQPDLTSQGPNNSSKLCASNGMDSKNNPLYPARCGATLDFPRFALGDGKRLFIADGGNDRVLVFNTVPTQSGQPANVILGQVDEFSDVVTDSTDTFRPDSNIGRSAANSLRTPMSLATDGTNLFVSDPFDRRVVAFTPGATTVPTTGITNAASRAVFALGSITFGGTIKADDQVTVMVQDKSYVYKIVKDDTFDKIIQNLVDLINGKASGTPDPNVIALANPGFSELILSAKKAGQDGNAITYSTTLSSGAQITATTSGANLNGGQNAAEVAPGTLVTINGTNLSDSTLPGAPDSNGFYPQSLGGVTVYFDGIKAPLLYVSPTQINTQIPFEVVDASSISSYVVTQHGDGSVTNTAAVAIPIVLQNPGIFAQEGSDPRPAMAFHASSNAIAVVDVGGTIKANDTATVTINSVAYTYTVQASDTLATVRDALIALINADANAPVTASSAGQFTRIILAAKATGPDGNGIPVAATNSASAQILLTALNSATCCASTAGAPLTQDNPAIPGEVISVYATGIGLVQPGDAAITGKIYTGPPSNYPSVPVDDAQVGGKTANVLQAGLKPGLLGVYEVQLQLNSDIPTNPETQVFIAQSVFTSNIVTIPVVNPNPPQ